MSKITVVCGWCGKKLGEREARGIEGEHQGICDDCFNHYFPHLADLIRTILEVPNIEDIFIIKR